MILDYSKVQNPQQVKGSNGLRLPEVQQTKKPAINPGVADALQRRYIPAVVQTEGAIDLRRRQEAFVNNLYAPLNFAKVTVRSSAEVGHEKQFLNQGGNRAPNHQNEFVMPAPAATPVALKTSAQFDKIQERLQVRVKLSSLKPKDLPAVQVIIQGEKDIRPATSATKLKPRPQPMKELIQRPKSSLPGKRETKKDPLSGTSDLKMSQERVRHLNEEVIKRKQEIAEPSKNKKSDAKKPQGKLTQSARESGSPITQLSTLKQKGLGTSPSIKARQAQGSSPKLSRNKTSVGLVGKHSEDASESTQAKTPPRASTPKEKLRTSSPLPVIEEMKAKSLVRNKKESVRTPGRLHHTTAVLKQMPKTTEPSKVSSTSSTHEGISFETVNKVLRKERRDVSQSQWLLNAFNGCSVAITAPKTRLKVYIGKGNNHQLIEKLLRGRVFVEPERMLNECHIIWTQITCPSARPSLTCTTQKFFLRNISESQYHKKSELNTAEDYANELENLKIFKFEKKTVVKAFERLLQVGKLNSIMPESVVIANHVKGLKLIARKAELAHTVISHCKSLETDPFKVIPLTYFVRGENFQADMNDLVNTIKQSTEGFMTPYIVKPGEFTNRGKGITMAYNEAELRSQCSDLFEQNKSSMNAIVQKYIANPLLFKGRKFDFRCYALLVKGFAQTTVYWYGLGYMRTSSYEYSLDAKDNLMVHLTNEAVQVTNQDTFGKHEPGNKIYYGEIEEYFNTLEVFRNQGKSFRADILPDMKKKVQLTFEASLPRIVADSNEIGWELLGYDFMLDDNLNVWLIEINQNPCMSGLTPQQESFISKLLEDTMT